jgi:hypothetical protein
VKKSRWIFRCVFLLALGAALLAVVLVFAQAPFEASSFEYGIHRTFEGTLEAKPYPSVMIGPERYLLVSPGKHGAPSDLADGSHVRLKGSLIQRKEGRMIELQPGSISYAGIGTPAGRRSLGEVNLTGEIVDTKCYFGVMNPGKGKVHRDCAVRCLSGGIPPGLLVRDESGRGRVLILTGTGREILDRVGAPVSVQGRLTESGGTLFLEAYK